MKSADKMKGVMTTTLWLKPHEARSLKKLEHYSMFPETVISEWTNTSVTPHHKRRLRAIMKAYDKISYKLEE